MDTICRHPERFPVEYVASTAGLSDIHRLAINGFPYNVLYRAKRQTVQVLAVAEHKREQAYEVKRI